MHYQWKMEEEYNFSQGKRGAMDPIPTGKTRITISLDNDVLEWFRQQVHLAGGGDYQTLINEVLRKINDAESPVEKERG